MTKDQKTALFVAMVTSFMAPFMSSALNLSITDISTEFNAPAGISTWVVNAYTLSTAAFSACMGSLADLRGRRQMILVGCVAFAATSALCALSTNIYLLVAFRFLTGISAAVVLAANIPLMLLYFAPQVKGRMLGISVSSVFVGLALGPTLGGVFNDTLGWRTIFALGIALSVLAFVFCLRLQDDSKDAPASFDHRGNTLYVIAIVLLMLGLTELATQQWGPFVLAAGVFVLTVFVLLEWRCEHPMIHVRLFAESRAYGFSNLATMLNFAAVFAVAYTMAIYLQNVKGLDAAMAGLLLVVQPLAQVVLAPVSGRLSDRFAPTAIATTGVALCTCSLGMLLTLSADTPLWFIVTALVVLGIGLGAFSAPNNNAILSCVDRSHYSEANATVSTMRGIGQTASLAFASTMLSSSLGSTIFSESDPQVLSTAIAQIMFVCFVLSVLTIAASLVRNKRA